MTMKLRTPDDVRRLFSALGDELTHEAHGLSVHDVDEAALQGDLEQIDWGSFGLTTLVAMATGWTAIRGYERHGELLPWGLVWAVLGFLFPVPAVAWTAFQDARAAA
jgi:hypothetical protein